MARPSLAWAGYNLFRLTAIVFLIWAFVAQFLALAADLNAMDKNGSSSASVSLASATDAQSTSTGPAVTTAFTSTQDTPTTSTAMPTETETDTSTATTATRTGTSLTAVILDSSTPATTTSTMITTAVVGGGGATTTADDIPVVVGGGAPRKRTLHRRGDNSVDETTGWVEGSGIPDQPGGVGFAILSRLIIAVILLGLVSAQLGWPEDILYRLAPWLGPQSTPMCLGAAQLILAIETLRIYEKASYRIPSWALLVVGALNIILGGILRVLSRRMPPRPPPALWFNLSHRFFFWRPLPNCYQQLFQRPQDPEEEDEKGDIEEGLVPYENPDQPDGSSTDQPRRRDKSERSNDARSSSKSRREGAPRYRAREREERHAERRREREERPAEPHTDVRQGGYPTFSGRDAVSGGRQIPAGTLERSMDGREVFVSEDGRTTVRQRSQAHIPTAAPRRAQTGDQVRPRERKRAITPPRPLTLSRSNAGEPAAAPESSTLPSTAKDMQAGLSTGAGGVSREVSLAGARHRQAQQEEGHKSLVAAAKELGPHFPLPPARAGSEGPPSLPTPGQVTTKTARVEVRQASESQQNARRPPSAILTEGPGAEGASGTDAAPSSAAPVLRRPPQRQSMISSAAPTGAPLPTFTPTRQPAKPLAPVLEVPDEDDTLAYDKASLDDAPGEKERSRPKRGELSSGNPSATASAPSKRSRAQQASNVRFELSPLSEVSEGSVSDIEPESAKIQTGIRIPGLGMTWPSLPFTLGSFNPPPRESTLELLEPTRTQADRSPSRERKEERRRRDTDGDDPRKASKAKGETSSHSSGSSRTASRSKEREMAKRSERDPRERRRERERPDGGSREGSERSSRSRRIKEKVLSLIEPEIPKEPLPERKRRPSSTLDIPDA